MVKQRRKNIAALSFSFPRLWFAQLSVGRFPLPFVLRFFQLVVFNHWIRKQIATETAQSRFKITILPIEIYLHVFPNSNAADFRQAQVPHGITHGITLRIEHRSLRHDNDLCFHFFTIFTCAARTSAIQTRLLQNNDVQRSFTAKHIDADVPFVVSGKQKIGARVCYLQSADRHPLEETR